MADEEFEITWECDDGYAGGSAPHQFSISSDQLDEEMTDEELSEFFWEAVNKEFEKTCSAVSADEAGFTAWAKQQLAAKREEG